MGEHGKDLEILIEKSGCQEDITKLGHGCLSSLMSLALSPSRKACECLVFTPFKNNLNLLLINSTIYFPPHSSEDCGSKMINLASVCCQKMEDDKRYAAH